MKTIFLLLLASLAVLLFARHQMSNLMVTGEVVCFEFIGTTHKADSTLSHPAWIIADTVYNQAHHLSPGMTKTERLRVNTYWDFLFIIGYVCSLMFLGCLLLGPDNRLMFYISRLLVVVGCLDALENVCLLRILVGGRSIFPAAMWGFAAVKFSLLGISVVLIIAGIALRLLKKPIQ